MSRRLALTATLCAAFAAGAFFAGRAVSDEPPAGGGMPKEMEEMMKQWQKMSQTGPQHEFLKSMEGTWVGTGTWTEGGMTSKYSEELSSKMVFGGRFLQSELKTTIAASPPIPEMTFAGLVLLGFDNGKQRYVHAMLGEMTTAIGISEGTYDAATKTMTMTGVEVQEPGKERKYRLVQKFTSADEMLFEMYMTPPGGKESKAGEGVYKRK